jgi:hypothetical protein
MKFSDSTQTDKNFPGLRAACGGAMTLYKTIPCRVQFSVFTGLLQASPSQ